MKDRLRSSTYRLILRIPCMNQKLFISYSRHDGTRLAERLFSALSDGEPRYELWLDQRDIPAGYKFTVELDEAIKNCRCVLYLMTEDSVSSESFCLNKIARPDRYGVPIIQILASKNVIPPIDLESTQHIDM